MPATWTLIEALAVAGNLAYTVLLMLEKRVGWLFGVMGSALGVALFIHQQVYAQVVLNGVYVLMGFYGWWAWSRKGRDEPIIRWRWPVHVIILLLGTVAAVAIAFVAASIPDARHVELDAGVTAFSLLATWMLARKVLESWAWWIVTDSAAIILYVLLGLYFYAVLYVVYVVLSVIALVRWGRTYRNKATVQA